jgi:hypothetical protein
MALFICTICTQFTCIKKTKPIRHPDLSESKFLEEEINSWLLLILCVLGVISVGEDTLDLFLQSFLGLWVANFVFSNNSLEFLVSLSEFSSNLESGWEDMIVIDDFHKWLEN